MPSTPEESEQRGGSLTPLLLGLRPDTPKSVLALIATLCHKNDQDQALREAINSPSKRFSRRKATTKTRATMNDKRILQKQEEVDMYVNDTASYVIEGLHDAAKKTEIAMRDIIREEVAAATAPMRADLDRSKADLNRSRSELDRSRSELNKSRSELNKSRSELNKSRSELDSSQANLNRSRSELDRSRVEMGELAEAVYAVRLRALIKNIPGPAAKKDKFHESALSQSLIRQGNDHSHGGKIHKNLALMRFKDRNMTTKRDRRSFARIEAAFKKVYGFDWRAQHQDWPDELYNALDRRYNLYKLFPYCSDANIHTQAWTDVLDSSKSFTDQIAAPNQPLVDWSTLILSFNTEYDRYRRQLNASQ